VARPEPTERREIDRFLENVVLRARNRMTLYEHGVSVAGSMESLNPGSGESVSTLRFVFGTDDNGRDVLSRVMAGTRVSLAIGSVSALGALCLGSMIGFAAGMSRGWIGPLLMGFTDLFLAIPGLFLVVGVLAIVGQSIVALVVVLTISGWMGIARIVRGEVLSLREREFVLASRLMGVPTWRIAVRHLVPVLRPVLLASLILQFANAVLAEAALGFLGMGIQPPTATWGNMMGEGARYLDSAWWIAFFPGMFLSVLVVAAHIAGERWMQRSRDEVARGSV
jgi:peptide/nickel transport system permease protein